MPGKLKVKIIAGRNLPVMDRSSDTTDAFVEIKLGSTTYKTDVCRKTLNPQWNSDWYKFEMEDCELQDEPLQIRIMDYDTYSANDAIGKVYMDLNPLLLPPTIVVTGDNHQSSNTIKGGTISGWLPVYDTMHGIRGEVNIVVKLELFEDFNRFRQSSCGVQFFSGTLIPEGYQLKTVHGFVEELVFADDPEYQWIDKIRTPRATNEARQSLFCKLSGEVKRKIGLKVIELGANCVVGYQQCFDFEGECGIVVRGIGTAVILEHTFSAQTPLCETKREPSPLCRRSSDSDINIIPREQICSKDDNVKNLGEGVWERCVRGNSLSISEKGVKPHIQIPRQPLDTLDIGEYPFLTLTKFPPGYVQHLGGVVSARAVKLVGCEEAETRDSWWTELRLEVRAHARALACNAVIGYSEHTTICEDVIILSASGTAAIISHKDYNQNANTNSNNNNQVTESTVSNWCSLYHVPYTESSISIRMKLTKCANCKLGKVGEVLMSTAELPEGSGVEGRACLVQALVCRHKKETKGELNAKEISDALPFLEYELYTQMIQKLNSIGANALIGLKVEVSLGERVLVGLATGTAIQLSALPVPASPADNWAAEVEVSDGEAEDELRELDLSIGNKETCIVEVEESSGGNVAIPPDGFFINTIQGLAEDSNEIGLGSVRNLQMFTQIWKARMCPLPSSAAISSQFNKLLQGVYFKLRLMTPCALSNIRFKIHLPSQDDLQISVVGMAIGLAEIEKKPENSSIEESKNDSNQLSVVNEKDKKPSLRTPRKSIHTPPREQRYGVDVTPLSYIPGGKILCYLGNINFFFIRESTCIRETGGLSAFVHGFLAEVLAIVRAHVTAIGGNALVSYSMSECWLSNNQHKNQAQCLINVGGDAVYVSYAEK